VAAEQECTVCISLSVPEVLYYIEKMEVYKLDGEGISRLTEEVRTYASSWSLWTVWMM